MMDQLALRILLVIVFAVTTQVSEEKSAAEKLPEETFYVEMKEENKASNEVVEKEKNTGAEVAQPVSVSSDQLTSTEGKKEKENDQMKQWLEKFPEIEEESQPAEFIKKISPLAVLIAEENGIYPSVMIAQAGLESAWGTSGLAQNYNNLMGTKGSWNGNSVTMSTGEEIAGKKVRIKAGFSVYDSWADSLTRYGKLLRDGLDWDEDFYRGTWRENTTNYKEATEWLVGRYATDSSYAEKLNTTIETYNLTVFDEIEGLDLDYDEYVTEKSIEL